MAPTINPQTSTFLIPLLLVIVERLATVARGVATTPSDYIDKPPVFMPRRATASNSLPGNSDDEDGAVGGWVRVPWVSRLNHIHFTNMALLTSAFILAAATRAGLVRNVLTMVVAIVWVQLPLLEVDEYDEIQARVEIPWALYVHVAGTIAIAVFIMTSSRFTPGLFLSELDVFNPSLQTVRAHGQHLLGLLLMGAVFLTTTFGFLRLFEYQIRQGIDATDRETVRPPIGPFR